MNEDILKQILTELRELKTGQEELKESVSAVRANQEAISAELTGFRAATERNFSQLSRHLRMLESDFDLIGKRQFENERQLNRLKEAREQ